jgi:hypothetical protein
LRSFREEAFTLRDTVFMKSSRRGASFLTGAAFTKVPERNECGLLE